MFYTKEKSHWHSVALQDIYNKTDRYREVKSGKSPHLNTTLIGQGIGDRYHFTVTKDSENTLLFKCDNQPLRFNIHFMTNAAISLNIAALW